MTADGQKAADKVKRFIGSLKHTKSPWFGVKFNFIPWQTELLEKIFGTLNEDGYRKYIEAYVEIPKKNGKSEFGAAIALYMLCADGEYGAEIYSCAVEKKQAGIVFGYACSMIKQNPDLKKHLKIIPSLKRIVHEASGSFYEVLSSDVPSKHGVNASCIIFDELHAQPNRKLWDVMTDGSMTTRTQPLLLTLTTAGRDPDKTSIGWEVHQRAIDVLAGDREEPYFYPIIYGLGEEKEWADPEMWREEENWGIANPSLGNTFTLKAIRIAYQKAFGIEAKERNFMQLRLNVWLKNKLVGWLKQTTWDLAEIVSKVADLYWKECYGGLDLSSTTDLTAMALFFPNVYGNKKHYAKFWYWMPEDNVTKAEIRDKKPYGEWARKGYITLTPGNVVDYDYIEMRAMDIISKYTMKQMGFDRRFATQPIIHMGQAGIECVEVAQSKKEQTLPINEIEIMVKNEQILHDKNPVTRMCLGNVRLKVDEQENKQFVKVETVGRMDGMAALSNAVDRWKRDNNDEADLSKMISFVGG